MDLTLRDIWLWLTSDAASALRMIRADPLDAPLSDWLHVAMACIVWVAALVAGGTVLDHALAECKQNREARAMEREQRKAASKDQYELAYRGFGWRLKRPRKPADDA